MQIWVGTSGYSYPDWVGPFYPAGTRSSRRLSYYSSQFPLVELNFTFYRPPTSAMLARLAEQTPAGLQFFVKMPRSISHEAKTDDLTRFREAVGELQRRERLLGVLCQLPQSIHRTAKYLRWLAQLGDRFAACGFAVEFRHRSWATPEVTDWLRQQGICLVSVDAPDLPALYPSGLVQSGRTSYVRFHSRNAANWYGSDQQRYDYSYSDEELNGWIASLSNAAPDTERILLLFNNCHRAQAAENARRMRILIERHPELGTVVPPVAAAPSQQRSLFDDEPE